MQIRLPNSSWMKRILSLVLLLVSTVTVDPPRASDHRSPFSDRRIVSASGQYYAVLRGGSEGKPSTFELVERREGVPSIKPATEPSVSEEEKARRAGKQEIDVSADPSDRVIAKGVLEELPRDAMVSDKPLGIVLFDSHERRGRETILSFLGLDGKLAWSRNLEGLFGGIPQDSWWSVSSIIWSASWGVDELEGITWVLSLGGECRTVSLKTGRVSTPKLGGALPLYLDSARASWHRVMHTLFSRPDVEFRPFLAILLSIARSEDADVQTRMLAALFARRGGDETDYRSLFDSGLTSEIESAVNFAALHFVEISKSADAIEPLIARLNRLTYPLSPSARPPEALRGMGGFVTGFTTWEVVDAFRGLGPFGSSRLRRMLEDKSTTVIGVISASVVWLKLGNPDLPQAMETLIRSGSPDEACMALDALICSHPRGLDEILMNLASAPTANDARLASYFLHRPKLELVPHLKRMLEDERNDKGDRLAIRGTLVVCKRKGRR